VSRLLNSGEIGKTALANMEARRKAIVKNWSDNGFLEGLHGHVKENVAMLYEGQASAMLNEVAPSFRENETMTQFHTRRYEEEMNRNFLDAASFHLQKLIEEINRQLYKKHC